MIELLVVIAIIAILAAMLLPGLSRSKAQAQSIYCKNNLHQMALALRMYVDDYKAYPYFSEGAAANVQPDLKWETALKPYYITDLTNQAAQCPAYTGVIYGGPSVVYEWFISYGYNVWGSGHDENDLYLGLGIDDGPVNNVPAQSDTKIVSPSNMYAFMDALGDYFNNQWRGEDAAGCLFQGFNLSAPPQHGTYANVVCCDAHVEGVRLTDLYNPTNTARNWNIDDQPHEELWQGGGPASP